MEILPIVYTCKYSGLKHGGDILIIKIEFENTKITLSVGPEGVVLDAPAPMEEETRQTTLSDAQWLALSLIHI